VLLLHSNRKNKYVVASELEPDLHSLSMHCQAAAFAEVAAAAADAGRIPSQPFKFFAGHDLEWLAGTDYSFFLTAI
jgi:hypothetical protein